MSFHFSHLYEDTVGGPNTSANHNGGGRGKSQRTGASDGKNGDGELKSVLEDEFVAIEGMFVASAGELRVDPIYVAITNGDPDDERQTGNRHDHRNENAGDSVGQSLGNESSLC